MVRLAPETWAALEKVARETDQTVGAILREAVERDLRRRAPAKTPVRADERLVAPLRALLAEDLAFSTGWNDLSQRLAAKGFVLREAGGGLVLHRLADDARLCKGSELGYSYTALMKRFGRPFPGHRHARVFDRALPAASLYGP
ncbi:MAG: hypothetical protein ACK4L4_01350 [Gemmobacter sp.]